LNGIGLRVDSKKNWGLFSKTGRPNRYVLIRSVGSRSGGSDPRLGPTSARSGGGVTGVRSPRQRLTGAWHSRLGIDLGCTTASAKERGDRAVAHLGSDGPAKRRRTARSDDERRHTDGVGEEARRRAAHGFRLHGPAQGGPTKLAEGSARPEMHWWPAIARRRAHWRRRLGAQIRQAQGRRTRTRARGSTLYLGQSSCSGPGRQGCSGSTGP
jgi:hypothetical protein